MKRFNDSEGSMALIVMLFIPLVSMVISGCATPLLNDAAVKGDINLTKNLLAGGANVNDRDAVDRTALHWAVIKGQTEIVRLLLDKGADVNAKAGPSQYFTRTLTPLHYAAMADNDYPDVVRLLLDRGSDINAKTDEHRTALHYASANGHVQVVQLLLERGANISITDLKNKTPLLLAQERGRTIIARMLTEAEEKSYPKMIVKKERLDYPTSPIDNTSAQAKSDIDELPAIKAKQNSNSYAIVIGIEQYRQKLPKADFAVSDAKLVSEYLSKVMGYPEENVVTLTNDHAAKSDFEKYFEQWLANHIEKDSTLFIYYSGHGAPNPKTGDAYLVPYDGDPAFIAQTGYPLKKLYDVLGKLAAKEIIVALDSCFSGGGGRSVIAKGLRPLVIDLQSNAVMSKNMTVLSASSGEQVSSTYDEKGHGLFTYFMLKGIKNENVLKPNGSIKMDDLFDYIKPQVERVARRQYNNEQTPQLIGARKN